MFEVKEKIVVTPVDGKSDEAAGLIRELTAKYSKKGLKITNTEQSLRCKFMPHLFLRMVIEEDEEGSQDYHYVAYHGRDKIMDTRDIASKEVHDHIWLDVEGKEKVIDDFVNELRLDKKTDRVEQLKPVKKSDLPGFA